MIALQHYHDLNVYHFKRDLNGVTIIGGWVKDNEENAWKRAIYLMPAGYFDDLYKGADGSRLYYLIENFDFHLIAVDAGKDTGQIEFAYEQASAALQKMGLTDSLTNRHMIIGIINDHIDNLLLMPPRPSLEQAAAADIVIDDFISGNRLEAVAMEDV